MTVFAEIIEIKILITTYTGSNRVHFLISRVEGNAREQKDCEKE